MGKSSAQGIGKLTAKVKRILELRQKVDEHLREALDELNEGIAQLTPDEEKTSPRGLHQGRTPSKVLSLLRLDFGRSYTVAEIQAELDDDVSPKAIRSALSRLCEQDEGGFSPIKRAGRGRYQAQKPRKRARKLSKTEAAIARAEKQMPGRVISNKKD